MNTQKNIINIVLLDLDGLPDHANIAPPAVDHNWVEYAQTKPHQVIDRLMGAQIVVTNKVIISREILEACPSIKHIAVTATGFNIIDIKACQDLGVSVSNIPSYAAVTVSEHVIGTAITLRREILRYAEQVSNNEWQTSNAFCLFGKPFNNIAGSTMGLIGMGDIAQETAKRAHAMGMKVLFTKRTKLNSNAIPFAQQVDLPTLLKESDIVSLHCSLNPSTLNLIGKDELAQMKNDSILINTARGGIVDEAALVDCVKNNQLAGIAFDVMQSEPAASDAPLLSIANLPNVILTPHISWASNQAVQHLTDTASNNIRSYIAGTPTNLVTQH